MTTSFSQIKFTDITAEAGIDHQFAVKEGFLGGGICVFDCNNDGFQDLYLTGGMQPDRLYLNKQDGTFQDILVGSGLELTKDLVTQGVAGADVNRDGWIDLFVTTNTTMDSTQVIPRAINLFFLNNGDNTFRDATTEYGLDQMNSFSTGVSFGDFNADGFPDAYVGNYFHEYTGPLDEINDATMVNANNTARGYLLLNKKGKAFENVYEAYELNHRGFGFGGLFTDFDNDGDQDLFVNHDFGYKAKPNRLLENLFPQKKFKYVEKELDMDLRINAMASAVGDYDNNGLLDYFVTNIRFNHFMVNQGVGQPFINQSKALGTQLFKIGWGANFADFDHDGDLDLFVANGDLNPNCTPMDNFYYENNNNKFEQVAYKVGLNHYGLGRGSVVFDVENDGDLDLLVVNQKPVLAYPVPSRTILYRNERTDGNWLKVKLMGKESEANGIGSRVKIVVGDQQMIREIDGGGSSHLSQNSTVAHFGIGPATQVDSVMVTWTGGKEQILLNQPVNQILKIEETPDKSGNTVWYALGCFGMVALILLTLKWRS
ncbi:MAG: CRTAC1 family protein [Bacteroidota bacterium]